MPAIPSQSPFPNTRQSMIVNAQSDDPARAQAALSQLCESYWRPLYAYARKWGHDVETARDVIQGYFLQVIEKGRLQSMNKSRGRLRTYLLQGLKFHISEERRRNTAAKRGGTAAQVSIDAESFEQDFHAALTDYQTPETLFEHQWALTVLQGAMQTLEAEYAAKGKREVFHAIKPYLSWRGGEGTYQDVAASLGASVSNVKILVHRMRQRYRLVLEEEVAQTVEDPKEIQNELAYLASVLAK